MKLRSLFATIALAGILVSTAFAATAQARDLSPCGKPFRDGQRMKQYCPLWRDHVPVYNGKEELRIVGYLNEGGWNNWFYADIGSRRLGRVDLAGHWNGWWAATKADNGKLGYVNQVYFQGGTDDEADAGMKRR